MASSTDNRETALEALLRRDHALVLAATLVLSTLAWVCVLWCFESLMQTPGMSSMPAMIMAPMFSPWTAAEFLLTLVMWVVMMVGMMTPSATPMLLLYARVGRHANADGKIFAATGWFAAGYLLAWTAFAAVASLAQALLIETALITPMLALRSNLIGGAVLIAVGLYQWTPLKHACLAQCQAPLAFILRHGGFKPDASGALVFGLKHGLYCLGCCWAVMALLFVGGVMNPLWIALLAIWVLLEKIVPAGPLMARGLGLGLIVGGIIFVLSTVM